MTSRYFSTKAAGSAAAIFACPFGPKPVAERPDGGASAILEHFDRHAEENRELHKRSAGEMQRFTADVQKEMQGLGSRMTEMEQKAARRPGGDPARPDTWGQALTRSDSFKSLQNGGNHTRGTARVECKNITTATVGPAMVPADYREPVLLPQRPLTIRQLLAQGETASNRIYYPRMTSRTQSAASVPEGSTKPQSDLIFEAAEAPVQCIAHLMTLSRQIMDDVPALASMVDSELRYGVDWEEDRQLLNGDGTGANLLGIVPQATAFAAPFTVAGPTMIDYVLQAIGQVEAFYLPCTGVVLHPTDWRAMQGIKDAGGNYMLPNAPWGSQPLNRSLWDVPLAMSFAMPKGHFLAGPFQDGAQIFDRMETTVELSTEHADYFAKNLIAVRGEKRLALAVKRPAGFVTGTFPS